MNTKIIITCLFLISCSLQHPKTNFNREYTDDLLLTPEQEMDIVELSAMANITEIEKIYTFHAHPAGPGIGVKEKEKIKGRDIKYRLLIINKNEWSPYVDLKRDEPKVGSFTLLLKSDIHLKVLKLNNKEYRVSINGTTIKKCEQILRLFQKGAYSLTEAVSKVSFERIDFEAPIAFSGVSGNSDLFIIEFYSKSSEFEWMELYVELHGEKLKVIELSRIIS